MSGIVSRLPALLSVLRPAERVAQDTVLLAFRLLYGSQFFLTGRGKLLHLDRTTAFFADLGIPAPGFHAVFVGGIEMIGGALLVAGLGTRLAAVPLSVSMVVAYLTAHRAEAFASVEAFTSQEPYPFLVACLVVLAFGPGRAAIDAWIGPRLASRLDS